MHDPGQPGAQRPLFDEQEGQMAKGAVATLSVQHDRKVAALGAPVEVRRHPAARRMTLKVSHTRRAVILTVPVAEPDTPSLKSDVRSLKYEERTA